MHTAATTSFTSVVFILVVGFAELRCIKLSPVAEVGDLHPNARGIYCQWNHACCSD